MRGLAWTAHTRGPDDADASLNRGDAARGKGPVVDFFRDYEVALAVMNRFMTPGPGTAAIFFGGGALY